MYINSLVMFKKLICIQRRNNEQERVVLEIRSKFEGKLGKVQGRGALGERHGAYKWCSTLGQPP